MKNLGERLRYARQHKGWSQEKLAQESGVNQGTISKIEREGQAKSVYAFELAQALEINFQWLLVGDEEQGKPSLVQTIELSKEEKEIIVLFRKLDADNKQSIKSILRNLSR